MLYPLFLHQNVQFEFDSNGIRNAPKNWGLDRIDQPTLPLDGKFHSKYTGKGVSIFIIDSGILSTHVEFAGRRTCGFDGGFGDEGTTCEDFFGHGSHVAGIASGNSVGVAKDADVVAVKIGGKTEFGTLETVIHGIDYVTKTKIENPEKPMVANMSSSGRFSLTLNDAIDKLVDAGLFVSVSAGNTGRRTACRRSPSSATKVITVGATDENDKAYELSSYGQCVDIYAPGVSIYSAWRKNSSSYKLLEGTSMAAPFVAGVAALHLEKDPQMTPEDVWKAIQKDSIRDLISGPSGYISNSRAFSMLTGVPNLLLNMGALADTTANATIAKMVVDTVSGDAGASPP